VFNHGHYRWFAIIECKGWCGVPIVRECEIDADDNEALYRELYGGTPIVNSSFRKDIEKSLGRIVRRHCEMSRKCRCYELHILK